MSVSDGVISSQIALCLEHLVGQEKEFSISVDTPAQAEQALKMLDSLESNAQVNAYNTFIALNLHTYRLCQRTWKPP